MTGKGNYTKDLTNELEGINTAVLQLKKKRDELHSEVDSLNQQILTTMREVIKFKNENPKYKESLHLKKQGIEIVKKKKRLEYKLGEKEKQLLDIIYMIKKLLMRRQLRKAQQLLKLNGAGAGPSKPKPVNDETENEYSNLLLKRAYISMKIIEIDDDVEGLGGHDELDGLGGHDELTDAMKGLIVHKHQLEKQKLSLDAIIEFMKEEIYTEEEKKEIARDQQAENEEFEAKLAKFLEEVSSQEGGKHNNKVSKQVGDTISPQDEYHGKLYLEDDMLYYYDMNYNKVLTDKIPIISIPKLEKLLKEYKKNKNTLSNSNNNKTNKSKKGKTNKNIKTQKRKL